MKLHELRKFIRLILEEDEGKLLGEPDLSAEEERDDDDEEKLDDTKTEQNAISTGGGALQSTGQIAGVITPLGTGPAYPADAPKKRRKKKDDEDEDEDWYKA